MNLKFIFNLNNQSLHPAPSDSRGLQLCNLKIGETAIIEEIVTPLQEDRLRMNVLGLTPGAEITFARTAPAGEPAIYHIEGTSLALRRDVASQVIVQRS